MISLSDLHDATLKTVDFGWEEATVHLRLKLGVEASDLAIVQAEGVTSLVCPRLCPWGTSVSVNAATVEELVGGKLLTIEMQSGDVLEICCAGVAIKRGAQ